MLDLSEIQSKSKRDLLIISIVLIFINFSHVEFTSFSIFGISGRTEAPLVAYFILWMIWLYQTYRFFVLTWKVLERKDLRQEDYLMEAARQFAKSKCEKRNQRIMKPLIALVNSRCGVPTDVRVAVARTRDATNLEFWDVGINNVSFEEVEIPSQQIKLWEREWSDRKLVQHEVILDFSIPAIVSILALLSGVWQALLQFA